VVTGPPIVQEVLQGFDDARAFAVARDAMLALPAIEAPLDVARAIEAAEIFRSARRLGIALRSSVDCAAWGGKSDTDPRLLLSPWADAPPRP
jgi:hypothetical protein